jgi:hypothetical protein
MCPKAGELLPYQGMVRRRCSFSSSRFNPLLPRSTSPPAFVVQSRYDEPGVRAWVLARVRVGHSQEGHAVEGEAKRRMLLMGGV